MKFTKTQIIVYGVVVFFFVLFGFSVKFPLFASDSAKQTLFQSSNALEIFLMFLLITGVYIAFIYFIPLQGIAEQIKSYRQPILDLQNKKFEYWLKSELYDEEIKEQEHKDKIASHMNRRKLEETDVLMRAAELNDMEVETYVNAITHQAQANLINAKSDSESAKADILLKAAKFLPKMTPMWQAYVIGCVTNIQSEFTKDPELQREIDIIVKEKQNQELRKARLDNDNLEDKYKRNQTPT